MISKKKKKRISVIVHERGPILFNSGCVIPRDLSIRALCSTRGAIVVEKLRRKENATLARSHLHRYNWLKVKLHKHLRRIAILTVVRYS